MRKKTLNEHLLYSLDESQKVWFVSLVLRKGKEREASVSALTTWLGWEGVRKVFLTSETLTNINISKVPLIV